MFEIYYSGYNTCLRLKSTIAVQLIKCQLHAQYIGQYCKKCFVYL